MTARKFGAAAISSLVAVMLVAAVAAARAHHARCPKGQVHTSHACKTPLPATLTTFRSSSHLIAAQLGPNKFDNSVIHWHQTVAYPYQRPCSGPPLPGVLAAPAQAGDVPIRTKNSYVGTTFSGKLTAGGGVQQASSGVYSDEVVATATGTVKSLTKLTGKVTITETRGFGPTQSTIKTYTTCGSTFSFTLKRYVGAFPGAATF
jgi:hypothetical protein